MPIREQQTTNRQHAIPQSIMSVEFKIIGDLTLKQFFFLLIFCGLAYLSFMTIPVFLIKWSFVILFVMTGLAFAFLPLSDRGLDTWVVNFFRAMFLPNQFVYHKDEEVPNVFLYQNLDVLKSELITLTPTSSRRKIEAYLEQQQPPEDKLDIDERSFILKVKEAYAAEGYITPTSYTTPTPVLNTASLGGYTVPQPVTESKEEPFRSDYIIEKGPLTRPSDNAPMLRDIPSPLPNPVPIETKEPETPTAQISQVVFSVHPATEIAPTPSPAEQQSTPIITSGGVMLNQPATSAQIPEDPQLVKSHTEYRSKRPKKTHTQSGYYSPSMTPDMHSGRRFINLSQEAERGEIILPIRGERVIKVEGEQKFDNEEARKVEELDRPITQVKSNGLGQRQAITSQKIQESDEIRRRHIVEGNQRVTETPTSPETQRRVQIEEENRKTEAAEQEARNLREKEEELKRQKEELLRKQQEGEEVKQKKIQTEGVALPQRPQPQPIPLQQSDLKDTQTSPNIVGGWVTTVYENNKVPVPGVVIVVRNQKKEVVRAVKANAQGKFGITTPLVNGSYTIEVDGEKKSGLNFPITAVEALGKIIPAMEITGTV